MSSPYPPSASASDGNVEIPLPAGSTTASASFSQCGDEAVSPSPPPPQQPIRGRGLHRRLSPEVVNLLSDGEDDEDDEMVLKPPARARVGARGVKRDRVVEVDDENEEVVIEVKKAKKVHTGVGVLMETQRNIHSTNDDVVQEVNAPFSPIHPLKKSRRASTLEIEDSDDDDVVLRPAIISTPPRKVTTAKAGTLGGLNRRQMEADRLARSKAAAAVAPASFYGNAKSVTGVEWKIERPAWRTGSGAESSAPKATVSDPLTVSSPTRQAEKAQVKKAPTPIKPPNRYPHGVVKKTFKQNTCQNPDEVTIEDVLDVDTLQTILLSAFQWDFEWILSKLPLCKTVLVMQAKGSEERRMKERIFAEMDQVELVFPFMDDQVNCMHSKLMLLFHRNKAGTEWLRVAIPTANLTDYDWGMCDGIMENMVYMIDLPKLKEPMPKQTFFQDELLHFCAAQEIPTHILTALDCYDFKETKNLAFVHSIGGSHGGDDWERTGYCGLGKAIKTLGYHSGKGLEVDYVTSSLGAAKEEFLSNMYRAAQGHTGIKELQRRNKTFKPAPRKKGTISSFFGKKTETEHTGETAEEDNDDADFVEETNWKAIQQRFRVFFPSKNTVEASDGGVHNGGTICFQRQWWNASTFPKNLLRDCKSTREGMLMHNKVLYARPPKILSSKHGQIAAWAYVGSANLSESAWGKLVVDRKSKTPKINLKNWECGVVIPVAARNVGATLSGAPPEMGTPGFSVFQNTVPVPMETPGESMERKQPWFFMEQM